jgi:hypothetical protein
MDTRQPRMGARMFMGAGVVLAVSALAGMVKRIPGAWFLLSCGGVRSGRGRRNNRPDWISPAEWILAIVWGFLLLMIVFKWMGG